MESPRASIKSSIPKPYNSSRISFAPNVEEPKNSSKPSILSTQNIISAIGNRFFSSGQEAAQEPKPVTVPLVKKSKESVNKTSSSMTTIEKKLARRKAEKKLDLETKSDRELRRYKIRYNNGIGNIMRSWMSLIYCILILRMNLIKLLLEKCPELNESEFRLENQIRMESRSIFDMIKKAQALSQERTLYLWSLLEKLITSRFYIRNALESAQKSQVAHHDWTGASSRLHQLESVLLRVRNVHRNIQKTRVAFEKSTKEQLQALEAASAQKSVEMENLVQQITECKKREVEMRGRILINMRSYKDLKIKKQHLMQMEKDLNQMKGDQNEIADKYARRISELKKQIQEKEREIRVEKEEREKLKASLEGFREMEDKVKALGHE